MHDAAAPPRPLPARVALARDEWGVWRSLREARRNVLRIIPEIATRQPIVSGKTGKRWHMVTDPSGIRRMLLDNLEAYPKSLVTKNLLRPAIGESIFIAEGADWRWQRRTAAPVFTHRNMMSLAPIMSGAAERCAGRVAAAGPRAVNLLEEMVTATFDVIADVTFSGGGAIDRAGLHRAIEDYVAGAGRISLLDILGAPDWVPRPGRVVSGRAMRETRAVADRAIEERAARGRDGVPDLLDLLMAGADPETGRKMTTAELRDNLLTFIVAGHETTALALAWSMYLLAFDPEAQERARAEARAVLRGAAATGGDVARLPFVRRVIDEALRLYPPAGIVSRTAMADDVLCGREIRKGDTCIIPIYALHRSRLLWDGPDAFDPDRFAGSEPVDRYAYMPFGDGPRICIGASFALQEAVIILATLVRRFRFSPVPGKRPEPVMILTLRPEGGVWLTAEPVRDP